MFAKKQDDPPASGGEKAKAFMASHWAGVVVLLVPLLGTFILFGFGSPPSSKQWCAYALWIMAIFWVCECIPLPVTSFTPLVLFPIFGVMSGDDTALAYVNDTVFVFISSLMLAASVEQSGLHKRLAYFAVETIGYSHYKLLFTVCFCTMFVSMWVVNTAATTMMVPIIFALLRVFEKQGLLKIYNVDSEGTETATSFTVCYFCSATYSATIGGIGTLIGTGTNLVFKGFMDEEVINNKREGFNDGPEYITFPKFSMFTVPYMLVLEILCYISMAITFYGFLRPGSAIAKSIKIPQPAIDEARKVVQKQQKALGPITWWEAMVAFWFSTVIFMFFLRSPKMVTGWADVIIEFHGIKDSRYIRDSATGFFILSVMFFLPGKLYFFKHFKVQYKEQLPKTRAHSILKYDVMDSSLPYSFMFLLGGGFALSRAASNKYSKLNDTIGIFLKDALSSFPAPIVVLCMLIFTIFLTNFASNVAVANVLVPAAMSLATKINRNPLLFNLSTGLACSYCFMLPVGTPGNLIVQSAAKITTSQMIVAGLGVTITTLLITWVGILFWGPVIFPDIMDARDSLTW